MKEYTFFDKEGNEWIGVRPEFKEQIKKLDNQKIDLVNLHVHSKKLDKYLPKNYVEFLK